MRRKQGDLVPNEKLLLELAVSCGGRFYGWQIVQKFRDSSTLYRLLARMVKMGYVKSEWDNGFYPARRYYILTQKALEIV